jgi:hypothetical protein
MHPDRSLSSSDPGQDGSPAVTTTYFGTLLGVETAKVEQLRRGRLDGAHRRHQLLGACQSTDS